MLLGLPTFQPPSAHFYIGIEVKYYPVPFQLVSSQRYLSWKWSHLEEEKGRKTGVFSTIFTSTVSTYNLFASSALITEDVLGFKRRPEEIQQVVGR